LHRGVLVARLRTGNSFYLFLCSNFVALDVLVPLTGNDLFYFAHRIDVSPLFPHLERRVALQYQVRMLQGIYREEFGNQHISTIVYSKLSLALTFTTSKINLE